MATFSTASGSMGISPSRESRSGRSSGGTGGMVNYPLLAVVFMLVSLGLVVVWSATSQSEYHDFSRQLIGVALGLACAFVLWRVDYRIFSNMMVPLLILDAVLLLLPHVPGIGVTVNNASSWIRVGIQLQPSEPCKIITILALASAISRYQGYIESLGDYIKLVLILLVPIACLFTQPDLGTSLVYIFFGAVMLFVGGVDRRWLIITIGSILGFVAFVLILDPILDKAAGNDVFIYDYQKNRLLSFINPELDPSGSGYNIQQAKIAIGSGGLLGKGLGNATQSALGFLPEAPTDFIFCVLAEELGFLGAFLLLGLYAAFFFCINRIAKVSEDLFGKLIAYGIAGMFLFQVFENIGMTCGIMPCTGIPLPFVSYGSSSIITCLATVGLLMNIWSRRSLIADAG